MKRYFMKGCYVRRGKRLLALFLCVCMVVMMVPITARAANSITPTKPTGSGTSTDPYLINTAAELYWFAGLVNGDATVCDYDETNNTEGVQQNKAACAKLKGNITVNSGVLDSEGNLVGDGSNFISWTPIGNSSNSFDGTFDGQGYTVSGLYYKDTTKGYVGLFGYIVKGTVSNVGVVASYIEAGNRVGGVCGSNSGTIEGCFNAGKVIGDENSTYTYTGGVCGQNRGTIEGCYNTGNVSGNSEYIGGVSGDNGAYRSQSPQYPGKIYNCYNTGTVTGSKYVGGVSGANAYYRCTFQTNYNIGEVSGGSKNGGLCGGARSKLNNCYYNSSSATRAIGEDDGGNKISSNTTDDFKNGAVAYLLNGKKSEGESVVFYQNIDNDSTKDDYPVLDSSHGSVYVSQPCPTKFSNTSGKTHDHSYIQEDDGHTCQNSYCGYSEKHSSVATFTANDEDYTISANCYVCHDLGTVTLAEPDNLTYDGNAKNATVSGSIKGFTTPEISYKNANGDTLDSAPVNVGSYTASITYTEVTNEPTVSVDYEITKATPTITWGSTTQTVAYTGNEIDPNKLTKPTVTLVNNETFNGTINYSYRNSETTAEFTSGLPTDRGTYEVKASIEATDNYYVANTTTNMTLTIDWLNGAPEATLTDQNSNFLTDNDWWAQSVTFTAPSGYTISNSLDSEFTTSFVYDTETITSGKEVTYYLKNSSGEIAQKTATVRIDKNVPTWPTDEETQEKYGINIKLHWWKTFLNPISFDLFYKETLDVNVRAKDDLSGIATYYYYVDDSGSETVKTADELSSCTFTGVNAADSNATKVTSLSTDGKHVVYAYAVDKAGNKSNYICSNGVVIDQTAPEITNLSTPSKGDNTLTDKSATITFTGSEVGTYFYTYKEKDENDTAPSSITDFATEQNNGDGESITWTAKDGVSSASMTEDGNNKIILDELTADTNYILYVVAVDRIGNYTTSVSSREFTTLKKLPTITENPTITGTYGNTVNEMILTDGVASYGDSTINGNWSLTDSNSTDVPVVGTNNTYKVIFTPEGTEYESVTVQVKPTVNKKDVTVTADNKSKKYKEDNPEFTFTVPEDVLVGSDSETDLGVILSCESNVNSPVKEGGYAITGTSSSSKYNVTITPGILTINKADAEITVGTTSYTKTFGDSEFNLNVTANHSEANLQYTVTESKNTSSETIDNDKVITVDASGNVTIKGTGSATITVLLPESTNYNAAVDKEITFTVKRADNVPNMPSSTMNVANSCAKVSDVILPTDWEWKAEDKDKALTVGTAVTAIADYNGADKGNYEHETVSVSITRSSCDHSKTEIRNAKSASCTSEGYSGDTYCKDCGAEVSKGTTTSKLGHNYTDKVTKEPTCTEFGQKTYTCSCGSSYNEPILALGHDYSAPSFSWSGYTSATATFTCSKDASHTSSVSCSIISEQTKQATGTEKGQITHTATATLEGKTFTDTKIEETSTIEGEEIGEGKITTGVVVGDKLPDTSIGNLTVDVVKDLLSEEEMEQVNKGEHVHVYIEAKNIDKTVNTTDKKIITKAVDTKIAEYIKKEVNSSKEKAVSKVQYIDLTLYKKIGDNKSTKVSDTGDNKLEITVNIPESMKSKSNNGAYYIVRVHDGKTEILSTKFDKTNNTLTFKTDKFSTYAIVYIDKEKKPVIKVDKSFGKLRLRCTKSTSSANTFTWEKVKDADGYYVYGSRCNTKSKTYTPKLLKTITKNSTVTWTNKGLKKGTFYKYYVKAYKIIDGKKVVIAQSKTMHAVTTGGKYGNAKSLSVNKTTVALKVGKKFTIKAKEVKKDKPICTCASIQYESTNTSIATVSSKGAITAKKAGTCYIYVYNQNGMYKKIKVTVKK